jgi:hypothetical protein
VFNSKKTGLATVLICLAIALAGCGSGGSSTATTAVEAHAFTLANAICREYNAHIYAERALEERGVSSGPGLFLAHKEAELTRLRVLMSSAGKLPGVDTYISDLAAEDRLLTALSREVPKGYAAYVHLALSKSFRDESHRLAVELAADEKALGLTSCLGPSPRKPIGG